jgi:E3 ubiquitin-protein ligase NEDD4
VLIYVGSPGTVVTDSCELLCGCWELNPGSPEEQPVLLTAGPSLLPLFKTE